MPADPQIQLSETSVAEHRGIRLGLSNVWEDEVDDGPGGPRRVLRGTLSVMFEQAELDFDRRLAEGDELQLGDELFEVLGVHEGQPLGGMLLRRKSVQSVSGSTRERLPWLDLSLLLLFLSLPHVLAAPSLSFALALAALFAWLWLVKPGWRGLLGFFGSGLLLLQVIVLGGLLVFV